MTPQVIVVLVIGCAAWVFMCYQVLKILQEERGRGMLCEGCRTAVLTIEEQRAPAAFVKRTDAGTQKYSKHLCAECVEKECLEGAIQLREGGRA